MSHASWNANNVWVNLLSTESEDRTCARLDPVISNLEKELIDKTWTRVDGGVKRFVASKDGGPRWEKVWKRDTYSLDDGKLIAEELISEMTRKTLN
eukprot:6449670-Amphidinium_carterae.1